MRKGFFKYIIAFFLLMITFNTGINKVKAQNISCSNVEIRYMTEDSVSKKVAGEKASVSVINGKISFSVSTPFKMSSNPISPDITENDFANGCPNNIHVWCPHYICVLRKEGDNFLKPVEIENNIATGGARIINAKPETINIKKSDYKLKCEDISMLHTIWIIMWIMVPILLILMLTIDYFRAVIASDIEAMKKVKKNIPKRVIAALVFALTPALVTLIVNIINEANISNTDILTCIVNGR